MAKQEHIERQTTKRTETPPVTETATEQKDAEKLKADLDSLIDEIDGVLTEEAQAMVEGFRQAGGE